MSRLNFVTCMYQLSCLSDHHG